MSDFAANLSVDAQGTEHYGDMVMVNGDLVMTSDATQREGYPVGTNPVLQQTIARLRTFLGEWFLDASVGVPWYQDLLGSGRNTPEALDAVLQAVVLKTPGILQLTSWQVDLDRVRRVMTIHFAATTTSGFIDYKAPISLGLGKTTS